MYKDTQRLKKMSVLFLFYFCFIFNLANPEKNLTVFKFLDEPTTIFSFYCLFTKGT
jgi:hypothetical protein